MTKLTIDENERLQKGRRQARMKDLTRREGKNRKEHGRRLKDRLEERVKKKR